MRRFTRFEEYRRIGCNRYRRPMIEFLSGPEYPGALQHDVLTLPRVRLTGRRDD